MSQNYKNFRAAIYARVQEVQKMSDPDWLLQQFERMSRSLKIGKIYLETHRDMIMIDEPTIVQARQFFNERGIVTAGGVTITTDEGNRFQTFCYTNPQHRQRLKDIISFTARQFDEIILDDFFFTNCKCLSCIEAKGKKSWTRFRLDTMVAAAQELIIEPARAVKPDVKLVIKYPNWYEHFPGLGFDLELEPRLFDGIYTGTETRDPVVSQQHLQPYLGYAIFRYFENIKPGGNGGGWVDVFGSLYLDRYAEQLWLTLFAKAPEITLFDFGCLQWPIREEQRASWQGNGTSFDFDQVVADVRQPDGILSPDATMDLAAGAAFEQVDRFLGELGNPVGVKCYKPYHSSGEDFLHNYLGMLGIPINLQPEFPEDAQTIVLTESAKFDPQIVERIKRQLVAGKTVIITSGLLCALQDKGIEDIVELEYTNRKATADKFLIGWFRMCAAEKPITVPQIRYLTNDSWEEVSCVVGVSGCPLFHSAEYANSKLYILTIPDSFGDLYHLPAEVLTSIKKVITQDMYIRIDGPAQVMLFVYDNDTFIVESFLPETVDVRVVLDDRFNQLHALTSDEVFSGEAMLDWRQQKIGKNGFDVTLKPHSYCVFRAIS